MLTISNVTKVYGKSKIAVNNINLQVNDGEIVGFIGPNGAGKTTTIKMVTGILNPDSGQILINGFDIVKEPLKAKMEFGFVPDTPDIFLRLKGIEYLNFMANIYDVSAQDSRERISKLAEAFEMTDALSGKIISYSHGMRQKIVVMGALLHKPSVWILDEPLTGLDPKSAFILKEMMHSHTKEGNTVFFSTHVLDVAEKLCTKVAIINKGEILFFGQLDELKNKFNKAASLEQIFLEVTGSNA